MRLELDEPGRRSGEAISAMPRRVFLATLPLTMGVAGWGWRTQRCRAALDKREPTQRSNHLVYAVDDVEELTDLYRLILEEVGYDVRTFQNRAKALHAFRAADLRPGLLITDYLGYPISAEELMSECRRAEPALKVLMASGLAGGCPAFVDVAPDGYLQKPFGMEALVAGVRSLTGVSGIGETDCGT
jgi:CheY-like chemotaxis protein